MVGTKVKHSELRQAVKDLQNRGLLHSARWAAEQLYGLEDESPEDAAPTPAFFSRGIPRHLSRSRPPFPSYLERI